MNTKLKMTWGKTRSFQIAVTDQGNSPVSLIGKTLKFIAKRKYADLDNAAVFVLDTTDGITVPGPGGDHTAIIKIDPANTEGLTRTVPTSLFYQLLLIDGTDEHDLRSGTLEVGPSVGE